MTKSNKQTKQSTTKKIDSKNFKLTDYNSKSHAIRTLNSLGYTRSEISKIINIRYQHVRNVLITPLMKDLKKKS